METVRLTISQRTVLRALDKGALLLVDEGVGARRLGHYLSFGPDLTPIRPELFNGMDQAHLIEPVLSYRQPLRWRASELGKASLAACDRGALQGALGLATV